MVFRDDVIDLEWDPIVRLRHLTVFTAIAGPPPYQFLQRAFHAWSTRPWLLPTFVALPFESLAGL
jgi:hypothetical protein